TGTNPRFVEVRLQQMSHHEFRVAADAAHKHRGEPNLKRNTKEIKTRDAIDYAMRSIRPTFGIERQRWNVDKPVVGLKTRTPDNTISVQNAAVHELWPALNDAGDPVYMLHPGRDDGRFGDPD